MGSCGKSAMNTVFDSTIRDHKNTLQQLNKRAGHNERFLNRTFYEIFSALPGGLPVKKMETDYHFQNVSLWSCDSPRNFSVIYTLTH